MLETAAHPVATAIPAAARAPPSVSAMPAEAEDAWQHEAAEEGEGGEARVVGCHSHRDCAAHCNESEQCPGWTEVHGDLLVTPVDTTITIAAACGDGVKTIRRSWAQSLAATQATALVVRLHERAL
jgi:hypothetical protein